MEDLYKVLQIDPKADPDVVRAAYRALAHKYHPDLNSRPGAADVMKRLNNAYEVLHDPARRADYDGRRVTGASFFTGTRYDADFADRATAQAEAAHPVGRRSSLRPVRLFEVRTLTQSKSGKVGLWLGIAVGLLVLLMLVSDIEQGSGDLAYLLVSRIWVAIMVFLILWGLVWSVGDLVSQLYKGKTGPPGDQELF